MRLLALVSFVLVIAVGLIWLDNSSALERCLEVHSEDTCNYALR